MSIAIVSRTRSNVYQKIILDLFSGMQHGQLDLCLPTGEQLKFGSGNGDIMANMSISDPRFFKCCFLYGDIGFGEAFVNGYWQSENVSDVIRWFVVNLEFVPGISGTRSNSVLINSLRLFNRAIHFTRMNSLRGSKKNIAAHYDLSNDFFSLFLDKTMTYSSAYFKSPDLNLEAAQIAKYERLCKQLVLTANDHVLEIGTGWGSNAIYMAKTYGCKVTSLTISEEQHQYAVKKVREAGVENKVTILLKDYRAMEGRFDKIVSIEMLEAVGARYYSTYFEKCASLLKKNGILALQVITCPDSRYAELKKGVDWIQKHIFPGSLLPSVGEINKAVNAVSDLTLVDLKDLGLDYAKTLRLWDEAYQSRINEIKKFGFDDQFIRKWTYYFNYCEAAFESRNINVMQMVYTRPNNIIR